MAKGPGRRGTRPPARDKPPAAMLKIPPELSKTLALPSKRAAALRAALALPTEQVAALRTALALPPGQAEALRKFSKAERERMERDARDRVDPVEIDRCFFPRQRREPRRARKGAPKTQAILDTVEALEAAGTRWGSTKDLVRKVERKTGIKVSPSQVKDVMRKRRQHLIEK